MTKLFSGVARLVVWAMLCVAPEASVAAPQDEAPPGASPPRLEQARAHFDEGVRLLDAKSYHQAELEFERSLALHETLTGLYNVAIARRGLGKYVAAKSALDRFLAQASSAELPGEAVEQARELRMDVSRTIAHVTLRVTGDSTRVLVDDVELGRTDGIYPLELDPGAHAFAAERRDGGLARQVFTLVEGDRKVVALDAVVSSKLARVVIAVVPPDAAIHLNGRLVGHGRHEANVLPGEYYVQAFAVEHVAAARTFAVAPGQDVDVELELEEEPEALLKQWWLWAAISAVVVSGAVAIAVLPREEEPIRGTRGTF